jgi:voltage-gated potassium channel
MHPARRLLAQELDPELHPQPGLSLLNAFLLVFIVASIIIGILETEPVLREAWPAFFKLAEFAFVVLFLLEFIGRLICAPLNPRYGNIFGFLRSWPAFIDIAVLVTLVLPFFGLEPALLRMVRALRILRLARLGRFSIALSHLGDAFAERRYELIAGLVFSGLLLLGAATALYLVEGGIQPDAFGSIPRALWWAVATLTTVGYGDVVPVTGIGRVLAAFTALAGIAVIAIPTGIMAAAFTDVIRKARLELEKRKEEDGT